MSMEGGGSAPPRVLDERSLGRIRQADNRLSLALTVLANEPSLTLCHVQGNVAAALPAVVSRKLALQELGAEVQEKEYDVDYSLMTLRKISSNQHVRGLKAQVQKAQALLEEATSLASSTGRPVDIPRSSRRSLEVPSAGSASSSTAGGTGSSFTGEPSSLGRTSGRVSVDGGIPIPVKKKKAKRRKIETFELKPRAF